MNTAVRFFGIILTLFLLAGIFYFSWLSLKLYLKKAKKFLDMLISQIPNLSEFDCETSITDYIRSLKNNLLRIDSPPCARGIKNGHSIEIAIIPQTSKYPARIVIAVIFASPSQPKIYIQQYSRFVKIINAIFIPRHDTSRHLSGPYAVVGDTKDIQQILTPEKITALVNFPRRLEFVRFEKNAVILQWRKLDKDISIVEKAVSLAMTLSGP